MTDDKAPATQQTEPREPFGTDNVTRRSETPATKVSSAGFTNARIDELSRISLQNRFLVRVVFLGAIIAITAVVVGYLLTDVRAKLAELTSSPQDNVQWTLAQFEVEYLQFALELESAQDETVPLDDVRQRYDILYSRTQTLTDSQIYRAAFREPALKAELTVLARRLFAMADLIDQTDADLRASLPVLRNEMDNLRPLTRSVMTQGNHQLSIQSDEARKDMVQVLSRLVIAATVLLITLVAMAFSFRRMAQTSDARLRENLATSARLETIFSTSRDAIAVLDSAGCIVNLNRSGSEMFGLKDFDVRGRRIGRLLTRRGDDGFVPITGRELFEAAASGRKTGIRLTGRRRDGSEFPVEITIDISTRERTPICVCVIRDIVHQAAAEFALKESRDKARAGERAKARFLGVISHEMRTPLNGILGTIDLIKEEASKPDARASELCDTYLPVLQSSSRNLLTLVNDVLDLTQIESGVRVMPRPFDADALIEGLIAAEMGRARAQNNTIEVTSETPIGWVHGDPDRLRQVLGNILANAMKFTRDGSVTIDAVRLDGDEVEFQIVDTGIGMSDADRERIFEDFFRTNAAVHGQIQGTGLGLGIARNIIDALGGEIGVESEEGEGSLFWVRVPLPQSAAETPGQAVAIEDQTVTPCNILVVEDNATNRFIARRLLENDGHTVTEANDGAEGVAAALKDAYDLILLDISMPVMDGIAAAQEIRRQPGPNQTSRLVALTAHIEGGLDNQRTARIMDAVLHKPLDREELRRQIRACHDNHTTPDRVPKTPARNALDDLLDTIDPDTAQRLIDGFITEADAKLRDLLTRATAPRETPDIPLANDLHALAGAATNFGASEMHLLLIRAEASEREGQTGTTADLVEEAAALWPDRRAILIEARPDAASLTARSDRA